VLGPGIETSSVVHQPELDFVGVDAQRRPEVPCVRMFDCVRESLLRDAQQTFFIFAGDRSFIAFRMKFRVQVRAFGHAFEQTVQGHEQFSVAQ
jgi:hypothetical protein